MSDDELLADAELLFFPAYTQPYHDPEELAHARFRKVVGDALAAAEARGLAEGYRLAIVALCDMERYREWLHAQDRPDHESWISRHADYLEAMTPTTERP